MRYTIPASASKANKEAFKDAILRNNDMSDMEKLEIIFAASKELKDTNPQLYYVILAVLDAEKKPMPNSYFD